MSRLRLVKGNTFYTKNEIRAYRYDGTEIEDFSLTQCKNIKVIANKVHSREIINNYNILDDHNIRIQWVGSKLQLGPYRLEITGKYNETDFRYFSEDPIFDIVNSADDQEIPADSIIESDYYIINGSKQYIDLPNITIQGIQSDWNETNSSSPSYIKNKPNITIPTALSEFTNNVGFITRYDLPQTDLSKYAKIENLATVATTGNYNDLKGKPIIPNISDCVTEQYVIDKIELSKITEDIVSSWGFTKNTGTYSKPNGGIPKSDLEDDVQTSLGLADTALQSFTETDPTVPAWAKSSTKPTYTAQEVGALPDTTVVPDSVSDLTQDVNYAGASSVGGTANKAASIPFGEVDSTSTATAFTATVDGITQLRDGICCYLKNNVVTSAAASTAPKCWTLNVNNLGAKPVYVTNGAATYSTTNFTKNYKTLFTYDESLDSGNGGWYIGVLFNTNTTYSEMTQAEITAGTGTTGRRITPKMLRDNFYTEDEVDTLLGSKANSNDLATVATSGSYNDLLDKPTIPAAPGTLNTTATTGQSTNASESLSGNITLHKISKTGSYTDLISRPTITSIEPSGSSHLTDVPVWENMINTVPIYSTTGLYGGNNTTSDNYNDVTYYWDTTPTSGSTKAVTSGGVYTALLDKVNSTSVSSIVTLTEAQYEALSTKDSSTLYIITSS